jgi:hypothetical protein
MKYQPINGWTKQSMLDHVKKEFKGKSVIHVGSESCVYRGVGGTKCAVGMFIPDEKYHFNMDTHLGSVSSVLQAFSDVMLDMPLCLDGLRKFQKSHDNSERENTLQDMLNWIENNVE